MCRWLRPCRFLRKFERSILPFVGADCARLATFARSKGKRWATAQGYIPGLRCSSALGVGASLLPARRATRVNPMVARRDPA